MFVLQIITLFDQVCIIRPKQGVRFSLRAKPWKVISTMHQVGQKHSQSGRRQQGDVFSRLCFRCNFVWDGISKEQIKTTTFIFSAE